MSQPSQSKDTPNNQAHTPGPWRYFLTPGSDSQWSVASESGIVARTPGVEADARLIAGAPEMADELLWIRENLHPITLGRGATGAELVAITRATMVLRKAGVIPDLMAEGRQP